MPGLFSFSLTLTIKVKNMEYFKKGEYKKFKYSKSGTSVLIKGKIADNSAIAEDAAILDVATKIVNNVKNGNDLFFFDHLTFNILDHLMPRNFLNGKAYRDLNAFNLYFDAFKYNDPRFMLFATAKKYGFKVQKGSKANKIISCAHFLEDDGPQFLGKKTIPLFCAGCIDKVPPFEQKKPQAIESQLFNTDVSNLFAGYVKALNVNVIQGTGDLFYKYDKNSDTIYLKEKSDYINAGSSDAAIIHALAESTGGSLRLNRDFTVELERVCNEITAFLLSLEFNCDHYPVTSDKDHIYDYLSEIISYDETAAIQLLANVVSSALLAFNYLTYGYRTNWIDIKEKFDQTKVAKNILKHAGSMIKGRKKDKVKAIDDLRAEIFEKSEKPAARIKKARETLKNEPIYLTSGPIPVDRVYSPIIKPVDHGELKPVKKAIPPVPDFNELDLFEPLDNAGAIDDLDYCPQADEISAFFSHIA